MENISVKNIRIQNIGVALPENYVEIDNRRIPSSVENQTASDLAYEAAKNLISEDDLQNIGVLIFLTSTPDYRSPASAMIIQKRLGINIDCIAFDVTISKNAFAYGLQIVSGLLANSSKTKGLLLMGDTPSKQLDTVGNNPLYLADGAAAIILEKTNSSTEFQFLHKTKSSCFETYLLEKGGYRNSVSQGDELPYSGLELLAPLRIHVEDFKREEVSMMCSVLNDFGISEKIQEIDFIFADVSSEDQLDAIVFNMQLDRGNFYFEKSDFQLLGASIPYNINKKSLDSSFSVEKIVLIGFGEGLSVSLVSLDLLFKNIEQTIVHTDSFYEDGEVSHQMN